MNATVTRLAPARPARKPAERAPGKPRNPVKTSPSARRQVYSGISVLAVGAVLTGVSLSHLAHGIDAVAHVGALDAWSTALGIDAGFIALETAALCATGQAAPAIYRWAKPAVVAMMVLSATLNALAYSAHADGGVATVVAGAVGMALPVAIYVLTRVGYAALSGTRSH